MFELRLVRHALALARYRNFARAAEALHMTQPSLSRSIAALEQALGVRLFDRGKNGVRPTAFGELLLARGAALVEGEADLRRELQLLAGLEAGTLRVGAGPWPGEISVGTAVARLLARYPRLKVQVISAAADEIARSVLSGQLDVGVATPHAVADTPRLHYERLPQHRVYFACRPTHPLAGRRDLELQEILKFGLASSLFGGAPARMAAEVGGRGAGSFDESSGLFVPSIFVNTLSMSRRIAIESDAIYPATAGMLAPDLAAGTLVPLDFYIPEMQTEYGVLTLADRSPAPATLAFIALLREVEAEIVAAEARAAEAKRAEVRRPRSRTTRRQTVKA